MVDERAGARRALRVGLAAATLVGAAGIPLRLAQLEVVSLANPNIFAVDRALRLDAIARGLAWAELAAVVLCALLFARWTARLLDVAAASGVRLSARDRRRAVWSWLTPVVQLAWPPRLLASLVVEVRGVRDAVVAPPNEGVGYRETVRRSGPAPRTVIGAWWMLWLASRVTEAVATQMSDASLAAFQARFMVDVAADALLVCAGMMAQVVVGEVDDAMRAG